jgi:site-specific DNA-methyltransferase (adenine-specific)
MKIIHGDCLEVIPYAFKQESVDITVTSPPYNLNIQYGQYQDDVPRKEYLKWINDVCEQIKWVLKPEGSLFLNVGFSNTDPWIAMDVANVARKHFILQNSISWVKSIAIDGESSGHFKPINSKRFINCNWENLFHFTKSGEVELDRLAVGVPFTHKSNIKRWKSNQKDLRCKGNCWFIRYKTVQSKMQKGSHPAIFPIELPESCIKLHGLKDDMVVLDPFLGIGSTLQACQNLKIEEGYGIELDKKYVQEAEIRLGMLDENLL